MDRAQARSRDAGVFSQCGFMDEGTIELATKGLLADRLFSMLKQPIPGIGYAPSHYNLVHTKDVEHIGNANTQCMSCLKQYFPGSAVSLPCFPGQIEGGKCRVQLACIGMSTCLLCRFQCFFQYPLNTVTSGIRFQTAPFAAMANRTVQINHHVSNLRRKPIHLHYLAVADKGTTYP